MDTIIHEQGLKIDLLTRQSLSNYNNFQGLLLVEREKLTLQKEITSHMEGLSTSYKEQLVYYQKRDRKQRIQNRILKAGVTLAAGFIVYQSVK